MLVCFSGTTAMHANLMHVQVRQAWVRALCGTMCVDAHPCTLSGCLRACTCVQI